MVKNLRKRHLQVWTVWAILLPFLLIASIAVIPAWPTGKLLQPAAPVALPTLISSIDREAYTINLRKSNDSTFQLEWINKNVLTVPTATIYIIHPPYPGKSQSGRATELEESELVGRIESRGIYRFPFHYPAEDVNKGYLHLILFDFIHEKIIDTINF